MGCAVGAVVAVDVLAGVALVGVALQRVAALVELEDRLWDDLVEGEGAAAEDLACVAVAGWGGGQLLFFVRLGGGVWELTRGCGPVGPSQVLQSIRFGRSGRLR